MSKNLMPSPEDSGYTPPITHKDHHSRSVRHPWTFRTSFRGKLILQRYISWMEDGMPYGQWRDATVADLADYFNSHNHNPTNHLGVPSFE